MNADPYGSGSTTLAVKSKKNIIEIRLISSLIYKNRRMEL
jgi:hypothetical protein